MASPSLILPREANSVVESYRTCSAHPWPSTQQNTQLHSLSLGLQGSALGQTVIHHIDMNPHAEVRLDILGTCRSWVPLAAKNTNTWPSVLQWMLAVRASKE